MEIVPYDVEYVSGQRSKDEVEQEFQKSVEDIRQAIFHSDIKDELDDNLKSDDLLT